MIVFVHAMHGTPVHTSHKWMFSSQQFVITDTSSSCNHEIVPPFNAKPLHSCFFCPAFEWMVSTVWFSLVDHNYWFSRLSPQMDKINLKSMAVLETVCSPIQLDRYLHSCGVSYLSLQPLRKLVHSTGSRRDPWRTQLSKISQADSEWLRNIISLSSTSFLFFSELWVEDKATDWDLASG